MKTNNSTFKTWPRLLAALLPTLVVVSAMQTAHAGSATWNLNPTNGDWLLATNWTPNTVPNGPADTATFGVSNLTDIGGLLSSSIEVNGIVFSAGASAFTITVASGSSFTRFLTISGTGVTNNSGTTQNFDADSGQDAPGIIQFTNSATAGDLTVFSTQVGLSCQTCISGEIDFFDSSTAGNATLTANEDDTGGGLIKFLDNSTGGVARVEVFGNGTGDFTNGVLDVSSHAAPGVTIGSLEGDGLVLLGANNLTIGSNNVSTTFAGLIQDAGSITKSGTGKLTFSGANTYTGGTIVSAGNLLVTNRRGSGTGNGPVQINAGKLGGTGKISGNVIIGTGSGPGAFLTPGIVSGIPATVTIAKKVTFQADGTLHFGYKSDGTGDRVVARGVTIQSGAELFFGPIDTGTITVGTVFTVINNTAATQISGAFNNLPDGGTVTVGNNTFQASYEGGTGNDLTLTVVP